MSILLSDDSVKKKVFGDENYAINVEMLKLRKNSDLPYCDGLLLELNTDCNCRCPLCSVPPWETKRFKNQMALKDALKVVDETKKYVPRYNLNFANEPLLYPHLADVVKHIHESKRLSWLFTNCEFLTEEKCEALLDAHLDFVRFAIDGLDAESHEFYRRGSHFEIVFENVMRLIEIKRKRKLFHPYIQIFTLKHRLNQNKEDEYRAFWEKQMGIHGVNEFLMFLPHMNEMKRSDGKTADELLEYFPEDLEETRYTREDNETIGVRNKLDRCYSSVYTVIVSDGELIICCQDPSGKYTIGNVFVQNFENLWLSEKAKKMRAMAENMEFEMCKKCNLRGM